MLFRPLGFGTLYMPAAITAATGAGYWLYCRYRHVAMDAIGARRVAGLIAFFRDGDTTPMSLP